MNRMKLDLATNFDMKLLDFIEEVDKNHQVISMFGKLKSDLVGGGRASVAVRNVTLDTIDSFNRRCRDMGISLNYLLNPLSLSNKDIYPATHHLLVDYIGQLHEIGIPWLTVCSPYLLQLVKEQYPDMKVTIGVYAYLRTLPKIADWIDMGADEITLMESCTRNFPFLETLLSEYRDSPVRFRVIANNGCLHECPYSLNHAGAVSQSSMDGGCTTSQYFDYSLVNCYQRKLQNPANMIASDWIRPEDLHYYEELCDKTGNDRLVIKLVERTKSTEFLCRVIKAYIDEKYSGNLLDLMNWIGNDAGSQSMDIEAYMEGVRKGDINRNSLIRYASFFHLPELYIDNSRLDGFLDAFVNHYQCDKRSCCLDGKLSEHRKCLYCYRWSEKAVSIKETGADRYEKWLENALRLKKDFNDSSIFSSRKSGGKDA